MRKIVLNKLTQTQMIAIGFLIIILTGTVLLMLPIASRSGQWTDFTTAIFTATSATCVTGLVVVDTYLHWSVFGQIIILLMIQIGGLGFMTIGVFFAIFLRKKIGLFERGLLQESVNSLQIGGVVKLVKRIVIGTALFEGVGAILLSSRFIPEFGIVKGIYNGIFHSISAFCNAGFDLMGGFGEYSSLTRYSSDIVINVTIMLLIIIGGIGFIVWDDLAKNKGRFQHLFLHTKVVLVTTTVLVFGGALLFFLFENHRVFDGMNLVDKVNASLFSSVTARTAGFNTVDTGALSESSKLFTVILMFIGGSPGSTAGGIKTTTLVVILCYVWSNLRNGNGCNLFKRRIAEDAIKKASLVFYINLFMAVVSALIICSIQQLDLRDIMFEVFSAIGTVGMSTGVTRELAIGSRYVIILLMYCGRIGSMTFALSFVEKKKNTPVKLPVGKLTIG